jgi:hypothetical protein
MVPITRQQLATVRGWFLPERPGPAVAQHVILTGHGRSLADRWPDPRALVVASAGNYVLAGDPDALDPRELRDQVTGFVDAAEPFVPRLREAATELPEWPRVIFTQERLPERRGGFPPGQVVRRFDPADAAALAGLGEETGWIAGTWGASLRVAAKLGFTLARRDRLHVVGRPIPAPPST